MTIFARMLRQCKADLHGVMDQIEDKGLLLKQYLREMESALQEKQVRQSRLQQSCRQLSGDLCRQNLEAEKLEKELDLAIGKGKDDIAKMLIRKRRTVQAGCDGLQRQLKTLEEEEMHLGELISRQQLQYQALQVKAGEYCRLAEQHAFTEASAMMSGPGFVSPLSEEEIELELLQRKEALKEGGAA